MGNKRGGRHRSDTWNLHEQITEFVILCSCLHFSIKFGKTFVSFMELCVKIGEKISSHHAQFVLSILHNFRQALANMSDALRQNNPSFGQKATYLICEGRTISDQAFTDTMPGRHVLLFFSFD